jgi:tRNA(fMet)-specific endonuclease VapC
MSAPRYLLDTNIVSDLVKNPRDGKAARHIARVGSLGMATSTVVASELRYGCAKKGSVKLLRQVEAVLGGPDILPLDVPAAAHCAAIRAELEAVGRPIGPNDLSIAAHARALGATVVTANKGEFSCIGGLTVENWLG